MAMRVFRTQEPSRYELAPTSCNGNPVVLAVIPPLPLRGEEGDVCPLHALPPTVSATLLEATGLCVSYLVTLDPDIDRDNYEQGSGCGSHLCVSATLIGPGKAKIYVVLDH